MANGETWTGGDGGFLDKLGSYMPAIVGGIFTAGAFGGAGGAGAAGGAGSSGSIGATMAGGGTPWWGSLVQQIPSAVGQIYGANKQTSAAMQSAAAQIAAANHAADLQAQAAAEALAFERSQAAQQQQNWQTTQDRNYGIYQTQQANLAPYRALGAGAIAQLMQPIRQRPAPGGSVAGMMGGA